MRKLRLIFRNLRDSVPHEEGRYLVIDADGTINLATWSPMWGTFQGWDIIANEPLCNIVWWAHVSDLELEEVGTCFSEF